MATQGAGTESENLPPIKQGSHGCLAPALYILFWTITWMVIMVLSKMPELLPSANRIMHGELIDPSWCEAAVPRTPRGVEHWFSYGIQVELLFGLLWSIVALGLQAFIVFAGTRWSLIKSSGSVRSLYKIAAALGVVMAIGIGLPLAFLADMFLSGPGLVTDDCPNIIANWAVLGEASAIVLAFLVAPLVATHMSIKLPKRPSRAAK